MAEAGGPIKINPFSCTKSENLAFSDKNPYLQENKQQSNTENIQSTDLSRNIGC